MIIRTTEVFRAIIEAAVTKRVVIGYGGSSAGKTMGFLQYATIYANKYKGKVVTLIGESTPVIKKTIFADWKRLIMGEDFKDADYNKLDMVYTFKNGSVFQFVPADDESRFHGMRQDLAYIDEAYNIKEGVYRQILIRTRYRILMSFNPVAKFWASKLFDQDSVAVLHFTYKDNPFLEQAIIDSLEDLESLDTNFYRVYTLGEWGSLKGLIFEENKNWRIVQAIPEDAKFYGFGHDWGFSNDPNATVELWEYNKELYASEVLYKTNLMFNELKEAWLAEGVEPSDTIVCDASQPQHRKEMQTLGFSTVKGDSSKGAVVFGINLIKSYKLNVLDTSLNLIKELRNYKWEEDKEGNPTKKPTDKYNHLIDALRYVAAYFIHKTNYAVR